MHSPNALINAVKVLHEVQEVQFMFCKLVSNIGKADEFARENIIRFDIHLPLVTILQLHHAERTRLACLAVQDLAYNDSNVLALCDTKGGLVGALLGNLEALPSEHKVQIEVFRTLTSLEDKVPEVVYAYNTYDKRETYNVLAKTKKYLLTAQREDREPQAPYAKSDVEKLLAGPLSTRNDKCTIS
jgi:hypothetical protein